MNQAKKISCLVPYFHGLKYLGGFLSSVAEQTILDAVEMVFDHNLPTPEELDLISDFQKKYPGVLKHLVAEELFPVSASMNRCIENSAGKYVTIWNVDDLRTPDSLALQLETLEDNNQKVDLTYGDYFVVKSFGDKIGKLVSPPEFDRKEFVRSMHCGPFPMWKKDLSLSAGFFDEQMRSGSDFDLMVRLAMSFNLKKTQGLLGYYLNEGAGLSTRRGGLQETERTVIELRYGQHDKVDFWFLPRAFGYKINKIKKADSWIDVSRFIPRGRRINGYFKLFLHTWKLTYQIPYHLLLTIYSSLKSK